MRTINNFENEVLLIFAKYSEFSISEIREAFTLCNNSFDLLRRCMNESILQNEDMLTHARSFHESFFDTETENDE